MGSPPSTARVRPWLAAGLPAATLVPGPWGVAAVVGVAAGWLSTRPSRFARLLLAGAALGAAALIGAGALPSVARPVSGELLAERAGEAYAAIWRQLDAVVAAGAESLGPLPADDDSRLEAFESLARLLERRGGDELTLLLADADGAAVAWAGAGLLHEPAFESLQGVRRSHIAGFSAVTLLRAEPLTEGRRPWLLVAGRSLSADRLPAVGGAGSGRQLRWTLVPSTGPVRPELLSVPLDGAPTMVIEPPSPAAGKARLLPGWQRRAAALLVALALLVVVLRAAPLGEGALLDLPLRPEGLSALAVGCLALGVSPARTAALAAAAVFAAVCWRRGRLRSGGGAEGWGAVAALVAAGVAWGGQALSGPIDLSTALAARPSDLAVRLALAAVAFGLLGLAAGREAASERSGVERWAWLALAALLASAAAHDLAAAALPLLVAGGWAAGRWAARSARRRPATLAVLSLLAALIGAVAWEIGYRANLRSHLETELLPLLAPPTALELEALAADVTAYLERVDLAALALQDPDVLDRQDLAFELWHHSPLATRGVLSALTVVTAAGAPSSFDFGLPLTAEGLPDDSPLRRPEPYLPLWDETERSGAVALLLGGRAWGEARFWLRPRPGFRLAELPLDDLAARLLRGGAFLGPPGGELVAPASFALYRADGVPVYTVWGEGPVLPVELRDGGRDVVATPAGRAMVVTAPGPDGVRALFLPRLGTAAALERVGASALSALAVGTVLLALAVAAGGRRRAVRVLGGAFRYYSRRLLAVYGLLLLLPVLVLSAVFVRFASERLERAQRGTGEAALESAQRVLGEYVLSLDTGFVIDTLLDNDLLEWLAGVVRHEVNLYWGSKIYVSSKPELFTAGFLPGRIPGEIYARLLLRSRERASRINRVGGADYLELYAPLRIPGVALDRPRLVLSVPLLAQQEEVAAEIASLRRRATLIASAVLLLMAALGARLARGFTEPLGEIARGTQRIAEGASELGYEPSDLELASLAEAIDSMAARIAEGRRRLTREKKVVELMVENITSAVVSLDAAGRVVLANRLAAELLGARVGRPLEAAAELAPVARFVAAGGHRPRQETVSLGDDPDNARDWSMVWAPLPGEGEPAALLVVEDVTEVVRAQRLEAWAEMARIIAHEIKNPLTPIRLSAEHMIQVWRDHREEFEKIFERCTENILEQVDELQGIAMEFSTYSRIPRLERRQGDLAATVAEVVEAYAAAPARGVRVVLGPGPASLPLEFDAKLVGRALRNLIENALRASGEGGEVRVALEAGEREAVVRVADRGPGVPPGQLGRIFDPYFSTHDTGTGLGLPITRRIAEAHGGTVGARNRRGGGLEVAIRLPLDPRAGRARTAAGNGARAAGGGG